VASFKSTLDEALEAALLLHVVDASDPGCERQLQVTDEVLDEIGAGDVPRLLVLNKIDRLGDGGPGAERLQALRDRWPDALAMSARSPEDVVRLRQALIDFFSRDLVEEELRVGWDREHLRADIYGQCQVLEERYDEQGVVFRARAQPQVF